MILQALERLYSRLPADTLPPPGYEDVSISFVIVIDERGDLVDIADVRDTEGKAKRGAIKRLPQSCDRPGQGAWQTAFLLWDHPRYVLGTPPKDTEKERRLAPKRIRSFVERIQRSFPDPSTDRGIAAVVEFYANGGVEKARTHPMYSELKETIGNVAFQLHPDIELIGQRPKVVEQVVREFSFPSGEAVGQCLISGERSGISRLHGATPIKGSQSTAKIHSFNLDAFNSYGKAQGNNAPVSKTSAFRYVAALNYLLGSERQCIRIGDTSTVFWATTPHDLETQVADVFGEPPKDDPDRGADAIRTLYQSVQSGKFAAGGTEDLIHVLGVAPNAARIAIRFWETAPALVLARRIIRHFDDLAITRGPKDPEYPSLFRLLTACAVQGKADNIPPNLGGAVMRSILEGLPYPATWLIAAVQRCRAEQHVNYLRASVIKASLLRAQRSNATNRSHCEKEIMPMLDPDNLSPGYRLGRLFAALEKIQEEASPGLNATIRDRYYGSASGTPIAVFPTLLRLKNHHMAKLNPGRAVNLERLIGEIAGGLADFPGNLSLPEQGRFALGYYHQRQAFFTKAQPDNHEATHTDKE